MTHNFDHSLDLVVLLDSSRSMRKFRDDTVQGIAEFLEIVACDAERPLTCALYLFDTTLHLPRAFAGRADQLPDFLARTYDPQGNGTALYTAVRGLVADVVARDEGARDGLSVCIITDGENNIEPEAAPDAQAAVRSQPTWEFFYLGAVLDAEYEGEQLGIDPSHCIKFDQTWPEGTSVGCRRLGKSVVRTKQNIVPAYETDVGSDLYTHRPVVRVFCRDRGAYNRLEAYLRKMLDQSRFDSVVETNYVGATLDLRVAPPLPDAAEEPELHEVLTEVAYAFRGLAKKLKDVKVRPRNGHS